MADTTLPAAPALALVDTAALAVLRAHDGLHARCDAATRAGIPAQYLRARIRRTWRTAAVNGTCDPAGSAATHAFTTTPTTTTGAR
jgi:hypothetical protein